MATHTRRGRTAVLNGAIDLFTAVGYHGASMRDIARSAEVTVATIYYHFASKQEILQEIMIRVLSDVISATTTSLAAVSDDPEDQLIALIRTWVGFHIDRQAEAAIGATEIRSLDEGGLERVVALRDEQEQVFVALVERGVREGRFHTPHPREAARGMINMGRSVATWFQVGGAVSAAEMADRYVELSLAMVRTTRPAG